MTNAVIAYSKPSCVTGRALYEFMKEAETFSKLTRVRENKLVDNVDVLIRWGNSTSQAAVNTPTIEINKREAIENASNKLKMMTSLAEAEGITVPPLLLSSGLRVDEVAPILPSFKNEDGYFFARSGVTREIRYTNEYDATDWYITKPINKDKEYRVHVFGDSILGIYEKIPLEGEMQESSIMKDHNSRFSRCNMGMRLVCNTDTQQMCINAVKSLGLDFGGVDVIREADTGNFYIVEVNSSPSLNHPNLSRYVNKFLEFINTYGDRYVTEG